MSFTSIKPSSSSSTTSPPSSKSSQAAIPAPPQEPMPPIRPENNLALVMPSLMLVLFLAALDQTIVATALPTIAADFGASDAQYAWVGTAYLLSSTVLNTLWGRFSDIVGRKAVLYPGICIFVLGSALCGASKSMNMLIVSRAIQGIGGGSIQSVTQFIVGDIVPLKRRGLYNGFLGSVWGIAAAVGPIAGGLLTEKASWRWCFFINLPTAGIALACLFFFLRLERVQKLTWQQFLSQFDFPGLLLLMSGVAMLVVGFATASNDGWSDRVVIGLLVSGVCFVIGAGINFFWTKRNPLIPPRLLKTRTTVFFICASLLHSTAFLSSSYYLPVFFQGIRGASPLRSGLYLLPFSFFVALGTIIAGQINARVKIIRPVAWVGYAGSCLFYGLLIHYLQYGQSAVAGEIILSIGGLFVGSALTVPLLVIQAAMPKKEMAASTGAWVLVRSLGGTMGIAIFQAVLSSQLESRFPSLPGYGVDYGIPDNLAGYQEIQSLTGVERDEVLTAFSLSLRMLYIIWTPFFGGALILALCTKNYSLQHKANGEPQTEKELRRAAAADIEAADGHPSQEKTLALAIE